MLRIAQRSPELYQRQRALLESEGVAFDDKGRVERRFFVGAADAASEAASRKRDENGNDGPTPQASLGL
jgi:hypothetical protein